MNDTSKIKLSETVVIIDAAFLNFVITDLKAYFEHTLNRTLQEIDLSMWVTYLMLDAGITEGRNEMQFLFVYDDASAKLVHCTPNDLRTELNGVAFKNGYGEYAFVGVPCEELVSREDLFLDLLAITADSADVKRMVVISFNEEYGDKVTKQLSKIEHKSILQFRMNEPETPVSYTWDMLAFSVMQALGIRSDEL